MKKITLAVLLTLLANILCLPLWTECDYGGFVRTFFNEEARVDVTYRGEITRAEPLHFQSNAESTGAPHSWVYGRNKTSSASLSWRARGKWQKAFLQIKPLKDGEITIRFDGPDERDEYGQLYLVQMDWRNVKIDGKTVFEETKALSFQKGFAKNIPVKKNEILKVEGEFRRHQFTIRDFTFLRHGNLWFFITGNLLFFALIYRLLGYIRGGGIQVSNSLFLTAFSICCSIPMIYISNAVRSARESRMLTVKPEMKEVFEKGSDYGRKYEQWFNDHMGGRVSLTLLHDSIRNKLSRIPRAKRAIYIKEKGMEFHTPFVPRLDTKYLPSIENNLILLNQFCQQNQIKFYVLEVPQKEAIYKELLSIEYGFDEKEFTRVSQAQETIRNEARKHHIPYIYPYNALRRAAEQDFVFYQWSHHWTDWGGFMGYRELMKEIGRDFPDMPVVSLRDYTETRNCFLRDEFHDNYRLPGHQLRTYFNYGVMGDLRKRALYNHYDHKNADKMTVSVGQFTKDFSYPGGKHKIMLIGTSQNETLNHFLPYSAAQLKYVRLNLRPIEGVEQFKILKWYKKDILTFKPDILIFSITTDNLSWLCNLCTTK